MKDYEQILYQIDRSVPMSVIIRLDRIIQVFLWIARSSYAMKEKMVKIPLVPSRLSCIVFSLIFSFFFFIHPADAHKVNIFAYAQDGKVYAEGYFVDGSKCKNSVIEVLDGKTGEKLLEGKTDDEGQMSFPIPRTTQLKLILHAGTGHQNEYVLAEEEVKGAMPMAKKQAERQAEQRKGKMPEQKTTKSDQQTEVQKTVTPQVSSEDLETAVSKVLDSKLQPVLKILLDLQERIGKPGLTEILGGIGYIIGILGIIAYFKGRGANR